MSQKALHICCYVLQVNKKGQRLECSHYIPLNVRTVDGRLPAVVYCHCNSGSKRDADEAVVHLVPAGISVVAFDFSVSNHVAAVATCSGPAYSTRSVAAAALAPAVIIISGCQVVTSSS